MVVTAHHVNLSNVARAFQHRPPAAAVDLVSLAAQVYAVDRSCRRGRSWKRRLPVQAIVSNCEPWTHCRSALVKALTVLTDDIWELRISKGRQPLPEEKQPWLLRVSEPQITSMALFSGGLDSFAGSASWLDNHQEEVLVLVSVSSSTVTGRIQRDVAGLLMQAYPERVVHICVPLNLIKAPDVERSQRTRGLIYTAIAGAVAHCAGVGRVLIFENGYGSINPRLLGYQEGAQATKSTHPFVVRLMEEAYREAGLPIRIELPYAAHTKAELLRTLPGKLRDGIRLTVSCDSFPLRIKATKQCGHCGSCILRQQALREAGLQRFDRGDYASSVFEGGSQLRHFALMAYQAGQLVEFARSENLPDIERLWPEVLLGWEGQLSLERLAWIAMLRRYGLEWRRLIDREPSLGARIGWAA